MHLVNPKELCGGGGRMLAHESVLPCGTVLSKDVVLMSDGSVCSVLEFWQGADVVTVRLLKYRKLGRIFCGGARMLRQFV